MTPSTAATATTLIFGQEGNDTITYAVGDGYDHVDGGIDPCPHPRRHLRGHRHRRGRGVPRRSARRVQRAGRGRLCRAAARNSAAEIIVSKRRRRHLPAALRNIEEIGSTAAAAATPWWSPDVRRHVAQLLTITFDGGTATSTLDLTGRTPPISVDADGGADTDTAKLDSPPARSSALWRLA